MLLREPVIWWNFTLARLALFFSHVAWMENKIEGICRSLCTRKNLGMHKQHTILMGFFQTSTSWFHYSSLIDFTRDVLLTIFSGKGSKYFFFSLWCYWWSADFIMSEQAFWTVSAFMLISNFACTCIDKLLHKEIYYKYINQTSLPPFSCLKYSLHMQAIQLSSPVIVQLIHLFNTISKTLK
jgi:hypothetical protein